MPFACIFVPDFPVEAVLRAEPELRSQPVAVLEGKPPLQKVLGVNDRARQLGIEPGMTKIQVEPCTQLTLRPRSSLRETAAHAALLDCAQSFSPRIEDTAADTTLLDLAGLESLFGTPARIARDLARRASDLGLEAHVAVASNPDTACLAARGFSGVTVIPEGKEAERLGTLTPDVLFPERHTPLAESGAKPTTSAKSNTGKSANSAPMQKSDLQDAARLLELFDLWGIRNLRALAALPEVALSQRLGQTGIRLQQLARGAIQRTLVPIDLPLIFEEAVELEHPLVLLEPLAFLLSHMLEQLCTRLASRALAAQELRLTFELDTGFHFVEDIPPEDSSALENTLASSPDSNHGAATSSGQAPARPTTNHNSRHFTRHLRLPVPMLDAKTFLKLLQLDLKAHPPGAPIMKIHLAAEPARPRAAQGGLFQPPAPEPEKLELTLARIAGMVGPDKVGSTELLDTHHPEGFRMQRFVPPVIENKRKDKRSDALHEKKADPADHERRREEEPFSPGTRYRVPGTSPEAPITALRIYRPPVRVTVTVRNGQPVHIVSPRRKDIQGDILWMAGPWRSSGDWWERDGWSRDEWDIALQLPVAGSQSSVTDQKTNLLEQAKLFGRRSNADTSAMSTNSPANPILTLYRLVHDLLSNRWFVEGTYD